MSDITYDTVSLVPPINGNTDETRFQVLSPAVLVALNAGKVLVYRRDQDGGDFHLVGEVAL